MVVRGQPRLQRHQDGRTDARGRPHVVELHWLLYGEQRVFFLSWSAGSGLGGFRARLASRAVAITWVPHDAFAPSQETERMKARRMLWSLLTIAIGTYAGLCLVFLIFQRSFIYMPTPVTPAHAAAFTLEVPDATVRISSRPHDGPQALVYFGGNAEDVAYTVPELATLFPERAIYGMHYRGYSGSSGRPAEAALRSDARALFHMVHARHPDVIVVGRSLGSSLAIQLAAEEPVSRLVLITPFDSILSIAKRVAPFLPIGLLLRDPYESWRYAPRVTCPTLVIAASHDELVPLADTRRLVAAFPPDVVKLKVFDGTDHNSVSAEAEFWEALANGR